MARQGMVEHAAAEVGLHGNQQLQANILRLAQHCGQVYLEALRDRGAMDGMTWDSSIKGFGVRTRASGRMTWIVQYRTLAGRQAKLTLGTFPTLDARVARRMAKQILGSVAGGADPARDKALERRKPTFEEVAERYLSEHAHIKNKLSTAKEAGRLLRKHMLPAWRHRAIDQIGTGDLSKLHHDMRSAPRSANLMLAVASKIFNLAERWGLRAQNTNPCRGIERFKEAKRERFPSEAELRRIAAVLQRIESEGRTMPGVIAAIRFLAMSGLRLSECLNLRWTDVDVQAARVLLSDSKTGGRVHVIGRAAADFLAALARTSQWLFPSTDPDVAVSVNAMEKAWRRTRIEACASDLRLHDLRHGYGTFAGQTGANAFLVRDAMGHKTLAMTARYVNRDPVPIQALADEVASRIGAAILEPSPDAWPVQDVTD